MSQPKVVRVALDWTPNTIHSGLYLAKEKGFYAQHGLDVQLLPPDAAYSKTPAKRLEQGEVDFAICPSESCIAYAESGKLKLQAIYAILQRDASAIASTRLTDIKELGSGKTYGSYNARYEDAIVKAMIAKAGGDGDGVKIMRSEGKLSLFDAVKEGRVDATWIFMPWEGVEAKQEGATVHAFKTEDYGVPYGYSPVIARNASGAGMSVKELEAFVSATREGYDSAVRFPEHAVEILSRLCMPSRSKEFLLESQQSINGFYGDGSSPLGAMSSERWETFVTWLKDNDLLSVKHLAHEQLFTNEFNKSA